MKAASFVSLVVMACRPPRAIRRAIRDGNSNVEKTADQCLSFSSSLCVPAVLVGCKNHPSDEL